MNWPKIWRLGSVRKGGISEDRPAVRIGLVVLSLCAAGCASVDAPPPAYAPTRESDYSSSARTLADELGLTLREEPELRSMALEGAGGRILFVNGTRTVTVAGRRMETAATLSFSAGDVLLLREDAVRIAAAWQEAEARNEARSRERASVPPPPPPPPKGAARPGAPGEPAWAVPLQRTWEGILIHHSATAGGNMERIDRFHRDTNHWLMIGYDFVICNGDGGPDGLVQTTDRWRKQIQGAHAGTGLKRYNDHWIGICLIGDFTRERPTTEQLRSLRRLVAFLRAYCGIPEANVRCHRDVRDTECPGRNFPLDQVLGRSPRAW